MPTDVCIFYGVYYDVSAYVCIFYGIYYDVSALFCCVYIIFSEWYM